MKTITGSGGGPRLPWRQVVSLMLLAWSLAGATANDHFDERLLASAYHGEGAQFGDLNRDGHPDLVSGPYWYEGPDFDTRNTYYQPNPKAPNQNGYTNDNFLVFIHDFNSDQWPDILLIAFPGTAGHWYENPQGRSGHWQKHLAVAQVGNESPTLQDINRDGRPDLCCVSQGAFGFAQFDPEAPEEPWSFQAVSPTLPFSPFTHGLGVGDINGDGFLDLLTKDGWYQQPPSAPDSSLWEFNRFDLRPNRRVPFPGGAQIYSEDFDGDGDEDLVMSLAAHGYGLAWFEQTREADKRVFRQHILLRPDGQPHGDIPPFSQLHAVAVADINSDGLPDIITGKCRFAHGPAGDPNPQDAPVLYWFEQSRQQNPTLFIPHLVSQKAGVGRQIAVADVNGNGRPDIAIGNKVGTTLLLH